MAAAGTKDDFRGDELALEADIRAHDCGLFIFVTTGASLLHCSVSNALNGWRRHPSGGKSYSSPW